MEIGTRALLERVGLRLGERTTREDLLLAIELELEEMALRAGDGRGTDHPLLAPPPQERLDPSFYVEALRHSLSGVVGALPDGAIVYFNDVASKIFGYRREEALELTVEALFPSDGRHDQLTQFGAFWKSGQNSWTLTDSERGEGMGRRKDGALFPAEIHLARAGGLIVISVRDVTTQKILRTIIDNIPGGITLFDSQLNMVACNRELQRLLGFPDWLFAQGLPSFEALARFNAERGDYGVGDIDEIVKNVVARARRFEPHVLERIRPNGTVLEIRGTPLPSGGFVTIYTEITERKLAEDRLREALAEIDKGREHLRTVMENLPQGVTVIDKELNLVTWNRAFVEIMELPDGLMHPGCRFEDVIRVNAERGHYGEGDPEMHVARRIALARRFEPHRFDRTLPNGKVVEVRGTPMKNGGFVTTHSDVTEVRRAAAKLRESVQLLNEIICNSMIFVWELDAEHRFQFVEGAEKVLGRSSREMLGRFFGDFLLEAERERVLAATVDTSLPFTAVVAGFRCQGGREAWLSLTGHPIFNSEGQAVGYRGVSVDVTEKHHQDARIGDLLHQLEEAALHDPLTGLPNRKKFHLLFAEEAKRKMRSRRPLALLVLDLDHFKRVNDTFGHAAGDAVLKAFGQLLQKSLRATDTVARFGGEEFLVLLPETDRQGAERKAEEIRSRVEEAVIFLPEREERVKITVSVGVCVADEPHAPVDFDQMVRQADLGLYRAKEAGRNRLSF